MWLVKPVLRCARARARPPISFSSYFVVIVRMYIHTHLFEVLETCFIGTKSKSNVWGLRNGTLISLLLMQILHEALHTRTTVTS